MAKKAILIFLIFINLSCKNKDKVDLKKNVNEKIVSSKNADSIETSIKKLDDFNLDCSRNIIDLIKSSSIKNPFKDNLKIEIEDNNGVNMKLRLFDGNDKSENTIGWVLFDAENMRLLDVTNDDDNPVKLNFNKTLWNKIIECSFSNDLSYYFDETDNDIKNTDCKTITVEMGKGEECILKTTTIENVYANIIKNGEFDDYKYLLKSIPKNDKIIEINKDGLMSIEYKVQKSKIEISFSYAGGVTEVNLEKIDNNIKRSIVYYAD